jgi:dihydrofolate reductase
MGKLTLTTFLTLDGVMQGPGGPREDPTDDFDHGGWLVPYADADLGHFLNEAFERADAFLLGRTTYQVFATHWPRVTDPSNPIARLLNRLPKHVASSSLERPTWEHTSIVRNVRREVPELKQRYAGELQVHGSAGLARTLLREQLVDELHLLVCPVILGHGKRLFESGSAPSAFALRRRTTTSTGVHIATYSLTGKPEYGSFSLDDDCE